MPELTSNNISFFPSFFLVGAPRCGTTALSKYLSKHPHICFSKPKEPHFFTILLDLLGKADIERDYIQRFFFHKTPEHLATGEGSVSYLYSESALQTILQHNPDAKFIVNVRNPIEMIHSYHARLIKLGEEDQENFRIAWELQEQRRQGKKLPKGSHDPNLFQYQEIGYLGKYLQQLFDLVGRERVHVVVFDDFASDTLQAYQQVLEFLGLEYDGRTHFPRKGGHETIKNKGLQRLLKRPPKRMTSFLLTLQQQEKRKQRGKKNWLMRLRKNLIKKNRVRAERPVLDVKMRSILQATYQDDVAHLQRLLNRDLSHWML